MLKNKFPKTKKVRKYLKYLLFPALTPISLLFISSYNDNESSISVKHNFEIKENIKLKNFNHSKVIKRNANIFSFNKGINSNTINNKKTLYEIKVLLNYKITNDNSKNDIKKDVEQYSNQNNTFLKMLIPNLKDVVSYEISRLSPFIWIKFSDQKNKEKNLEYISSKNFVNTIFSYENNIKDTSPNAVYEPSPIQEGEPGGAFYHDVSNFISRDDLSEEFKIINFSQLRDKETQEIQTWKKSFSSYSSIGILEAKYGIINSNLDIFKNKSAETYEDSSQIKANHANLVAAIAAGRTGVDRLAKIYSAGFYYTNSLWQKKLEWMVIDKNIKVINHSYGSDRKLNKVEYDEDTFFLDYIARKYGVVNVFAAGNGDDDHDNKDEWIDGTSLSLNSIVVGAINGNRNSYKRSLFSNHLKFGKYLDLPKPLISAPGENIGTKELQKDEGTSFAAPFVSGAISFVLRERSSVFNDDNRVQSIKAILAASAYNNQQQSKILENGLLPEIGAGILDVKKMFEAIDNLKTITIHNEQKETVFYYGSVNLKKGEKIQISSAWLFNAGMLVSKEAAPSVDYSSAWIPFWGPISLTKDTINLKIWKDNHNSEYQLSKDTTFEKQNNRLFTDYDLWLEEKAGESDWNRVKRISVTSSNVEIIRHTATSDNEYRIRITKHGDSYFNNSVPDKLAVTFTKS